MENQKQITINEQEENLILDILNEKLKVKNLDKHTTITVNSIINKLKTYE